MRTALFVIALAFASLPLRAAPPLAQPETGPTSTVPPAAADAGKDVVHQLNSAFTKVFEIVAPSVVIIEVTKRPTPATNSSSTISFSRTSGRQRPRRARARTSRQSEVGIICARDGYIYNNYHVLEGGPGGREVKEGREFQCEDRRHGRKTDLARHQDEARTAVAQFADAMPPGDTSPSRSARRSSSITLQPTADQRKGGTTAPSGGYSISDYSTDAQSIRQQRRPACESMGTWSA